jgi:hypothetical protein
MSRARVGLGHPRIRLWEATARVVPSPCADGSVEAHPPDVVLARKLRLGDGLTLAILAAQGREQAEE